MSERIEMARRKDELWAWLLELEGRRACGLLSEAAFMDLEFALLFELTRLQEALHDFEPPKHLKQPHA
jgi:hypothetical protein